VYLLSMPIGWVQRHARLLALLCWLTGLVLFFAALVLQILVLLDYAPGIHVSGRDFAFGLVLSLGQLSLLGFGALIIARWPDHLIGWLFTLIGLANVYQAFASAYEYLAGTRPWPLLRWVLWIASAPDLAPFLTLLIVVPYLFPHGHLLSPRWRPLFALSLAMIVAYALYGTFGVEFVGLESSQVNANPVHISVMAGVLDLIQALGMVVIPLTFLGAVASLGVRFRRARGVERLQLRWLFWMIGLVFVGVLAFLIGEVVAPSVINPDDDTWKLPELVLGVSILIGINFGIPAVLGLAILRYRMYSIDLIIRRTLVYGTLSIGLDATNWGSVVVLQQLLDPVTGRSDVAVAGSTLAVAALFQPLRRRIQRLVDLRFFRPRYDVDRIVETFSRTTRNEVDLDRLQAELVTVVTDAIRPTSISLWLREQ
jgi:hypothetical protein